MKRQYRQYTDINITLDNFFRVFIISSTARCNSLHLKCNTITNHQNQRKTQKLCDIWPSLCRDVQNKTEGRPLYLSKISVLSDASGLAACCTKASTYRTDNSAERFHVKTSGHQQKNKHLIQSTFLLMSSVSLWAVWRGPLLFGGIFYSSSIQNVIMHGILNVRFDETSQSCFGLIKQKASMAPWQTLRIMLLRYFYATLLLHHHCAREPLESA